MEERNNPFSKFQLIYRRSNPVVKIVVIVAIVFSMLAVVTMNWIRAGIEDKTDLLRAQAAQLQQENADLDHKISILGSVQSVRQIAEEFLGLVDPDTVMIETE